ncbi:MAG TPA: MerR family transcriptional regulator [Thermoanaerobaculia bacterium]
MARAASEADKLYKIGEVCKLADLQPYVLRYWETEFPQLSPNKSGGGQRLYTRAEVDTILRIKELLYRDGFTIAGAKKKLESDLTAPPPASANATADVPEPPAAATAGPEVVRTLAGIQRELRAILTMLDK